MNNPHLQTADQQTWLGFIRAHVMGFALLVVFPALVTAFMPVSWIRFSRSGENVSATVDVCFFFVFPFRTVEINSVTGIDDQLIFGEWIRKPGEQLSRRTDDSATLVITGRDNQATVYVAPINIRDVKSRAKNFLDDQDAKSLRMTVVANWIFSVGVGGFVSLMTLLYVVAVTSSFVSWLMKLSGVRKTAGVNAP